jgi:hypothetical protein
VRIRTMLFALTVLCLPESQSAGGMTLEERRAYLEKLLQILPDPLKFLDGEPVHTREEWQARRTEIRKLYEKYDLGTFPPKTKLDRVALLDETPGNGYLVRKDQAQKVYELYNASGKPARLRTR